MRLLGALRLRLALCLLGALLGLLRALLARLLLFRLALLHFLFALRALLGSNEAIRRMSASAAARCAPAGTEPLARRARPCLWHR